MSYNYKDALDYPPEEMVPNGTTAVLTGIIRNGEFNYYVLPRHLLYLDGRKSVIHGHDSAFYDGMPGRFNIMVVNDEYENAYFEGIEPYKRDGRRLLEEVLMCLKKNERCNFYTEVIIDFDRKHLASYFGEPFYFEKDVPDGWTSERAGWGCGEYFFMDDGPNGKPERNIGIGGLEKDYIPLDKRFWIDENGKSIFKFLYEEDLRTGREKPWRPVPKERVESWESEVKKQNTEFWDAYKKQMEDIDLDWIPEEPQFWIADNERNLIKLLYNVELRQGGKEFYEATFGCVVPNRAKKPKKGE